MFLFSLLVSFQYTELGFLIFLCVWAINYFVGFWNAGVCSYILLRQNHIKHFMMQCAFLILTANPVNWFGWPWCIDIVTSPGISTQRMLCVLCCGWWFQKYFWDWVVKYFWVLSPSFLWEGKWRHLGRHLNVPQISNHLPLEISNWGFLSTIPLINTAASLGVYLAGDKFYH